MTRPLISTLSLILVGSLACAADRVNGPAPGGGPAPSGYALAAVLDDAGVPVPVPAVFPRSDTGDTLRVLAGAFELGAGRTWRWHQIAEWASAGGREPHDVELTGSYTPRPQGGGLVLDLYPGQFVTADRPGIAFVRGDTLFYGASIFTRTE